MPHTKGPWKAQSEPMDSGLGRVLYYDIVDLQGRTIGDTANSEVAVIHTEHDESGKHQWDEQGRIDARLMAAAPELLEVAKRVVEVFEGSRDPQEDAMSTQAKAAISKAEGK